MITGIKQIHINVEDINRALDFYQNTLGLELQMSFPEQNMAFFDCGGARLYLGANPEYKSNPFIYYNSDDIQGDYQSMLAKGVNFQKEPMMIHKTDSFESWLCAFEDSEGNVLHLMQDKPKD